MIMITMKMMQSYGDDDGDSDGMAKYNKCDHNQLIMDKNDDDDDQGDDIYIYIYMYRYRYIIK